MITLKEKNNNKIQYHNYAFIPSSRAILFYVGGQLQITNRRIIYSEKKSIKDS